ncbi:hypothetical protein ACFWEB_31145 [Streptomyces parvus]|uniref:hypothetical protein n=1 Tax=Streptomyces parvus TaxID=66428 RepID=UPI003647C751
MADDEPEHAARLHDAAEGAAVTTASPKGMIEVAEAVVSADSARAGRLLWQATENLMPGTDSSGRVRDDGPAARAVAVVAAKAVELVSDERARSCVEAAERVIKACTCEDCRLRALITLNRAALPEHLNRQRGS